MKYENDQEILNAYNVLHRRLSKAKREKDEAEIEFCKKHMFRLYMEVGTDTIERVTGKDKKSKGGRKKKEEINQKQPNGE